MKKIIAILFLTALGACSSQYNGIEQSLSAQERYPIKVSPDMASLEVVVQPGQKGLSNEDANMVNAFIGEYKMRGHSLLSVSLPRGSLNAQSSQSAGREIKNMITARGLSDAYIDGSVYDASPSDSSAPVVLQFTRYSATASECGNWSDNMSRSGTNEPWKNFGCATQNNLASMLEDPHDLVAPRGMGASDIQRRTTIFESYRKGEVTSAERSSEESGKASKVDQK